MRGDYEIKMAENKRAICFTKGAPKEAYIIADIL
jgi:hypothetical protein